MEVLRERRKVATYRLPTVGGGYRRINAAPTHERFIEILAEQQWESFCAIYDVKISRKRKYSAFLNGNNGEWTNGDDMANVANANNIQVQNQLMRRVARNHVHQRHRGGNGAGPAPCNCNNMNCPLPHPNRGPNGPPQPIINNQAPAQVGPGGQGNQPAAPAGIQPNQLRREFVYYKSNGHRNVTIWSSTWKMVRILTPLAMVEVFNAYQALKWVADFVGPASVPIGGLLPVVGRCVLRGRCLFELFTFSRCVYDTCAAWWENYWKPTPARDDSNQLKDRHLEELSDHTQAAYDPINQLGYDYAEEVDIIEPLLLHLRKTHPGATATTKLLHTLKFSSKEYVEHYTQTQILDTCRKYLNEVEGVDLNSKWSADSTNIRVRA